MIFSLSSPLPWHLVNLRKAVVAGALSVTLGVAAATPAIADDIPIFAPNVEAFTLDNGIDVVVIPDRRAPVVTHMLWYKVGAADEPPGVSGIAHFLEHLLFKGTTNYPDGRFSEIVSEIGGQENAFTAQDYTGYFQRVAKEHLGLMMELEADRMRNLLLKEEVVGPEREVILEERRSRIDNNPGSRLSEALTAAFYKAHPYGTPIIGWEHEMRDLDRADALEFYNTFYGPQNAVLVVAGDVDVATVRTLAEEHYGVIQPTGDPVVRTRPQEPPAQAKRRVTLVDERAPQPSWQRAYLVPSYTRADDGEAEALDILAEIIGGGPTSRLYRGLVVDQPLATAAGAWYQGTAFDHTRFGLYGTPRGETDVVALEDAIEAIVDDVIENGVTEDEVERVRKSMLAAAIYAQDSQARMARVFGTALTSGETIEDVQNWPARIAAVTPEDVQAVAKKYLRHAVSATGVLLPKPSDDDVDPS
ncbi:MAG: pitrilysin family protein [Pseudomonadota bacterium]